MSKIDQFAPHIHLNIEWKARNSKTNLKSSIKNFPMDIALQLNLSLKSINFSFISKHLVSYIVHKFLQFWKRLCSYTYFQSDKKLTQFRLKLYKIYFDNSCEYRYIIPLQFPFRFLCEDIWKIYRQICNRMLLSNGWFLFWIKQTPKKRRIIYTINSVVNKCNVSKMLKRLLF